MGLDVSCAFEGARLLTVGCEGSRVLRIDDDRMVRHHVVRYIINRCVLDLLETTLGNLREARVESEEQVRRAGRRLVSYSSPMQMRVDELKDFLFANLYRHYRVVRMGDKAGRILRDLFEAYIAEPMQLPPRQLERHGTQRGNRLARPVDAGSH